MTSMLTIDNFLREIIEKSRRTIHQYCKRLWITNKCLSTSVMQWSGVAQLANFSESNVYRIIYQIKFWEYETTKTISN